MDTGINTDKIYNIVISTVNFKTPSSLTQDVLMKQKCLLLEVTTLSRALCQRKVPQRMYRIFSEWKMEEKKRIEPYANFATKLLSPQVVALLI